jgi:membrane protein DedA with SNARE-associated domain
MHILAGSPPPPLPGFLNALGGPLSHYGYWLVLALVMLEDFGIPVPGETVLIAAAIFAGHGQLNVVAVAVIGFVAAVTGDNIGFAIGHFGGRAVALRWGRYVFLTEERLTKAEYFFDRHGGKIIVVARFIEGLRQANGIIAGITGMHWRRFVIWNALGAALWVGTWVTVGYVAGNHINTIYHYLTVYSYYLLIAAAVLLTAYIVWRFLRRRARSAEKAASEPREDAAAVENTAVPETPAAEEDAAVKESPTAEEGTTGEDGAAAEDKAAAEDRAAVKESPAVDGSQEGPAGQAGRGARASDAVREDHRAQERSNTQGS